MDSNDLITFKNHFFRGFRFTSLIFAIFLACHPLHQEASAQETEVEEETEQESEQQESVSSETVDEIKENSYVQDFNNDGQITISAFGDSITRGTGDFIAAHSYSPSVFQPTTEAGYPLRIELTANLPVTNLGVPGEILSEQGLRRFLQEIPSTTPDIVILSGGSNDAVFQVHQNDYFRSVQIMINIAKAVGTQVVVANTPPSCCDHGGHHTFTDAYDYQLSRLAVLNDVPHVDVHGAFINTCGHREDCYLLNLPEGLHPNSEGYDVLGEAILAGLYKIDLTQPSGAAIYEAVFNLSQDSVSTKPIIQE
jgi:lysophospholipase L1-like esterase